MIHLTKTEDITNSRSNGKEQIFKYMVRFCHCNSSAQMQNKFTDTHRDCQLLYLWTKLILLQACRSSRSFTFLIKVFKQSNKINNNPRKRAIFNISKLCNQLQQQKSACILLKSFRQEFHDDLQEIDFPLSSKGSAAVEFALRRQQMNRPVKHFSN